MGTVSQQPPEFPKEPGFVPVEPSQKVKEEQKKVDSLREKMISQKQAEPTPAATPVTTSAAAAPPSILDPDFIVDEKTFRVYCDALDELQWIFRDFDVPRFLAGLPDTASDKKLEEGIQKVQHFARKLANHKDISLAKSYKLLVGILDRYDALQIKNWHVHKVSPQSTFGLRSAVLSASHRDACGLESWSVYTKAGKPTTDKKWAFLDNPKNWIPETQGAIAKYLETSMVRARELSLEQGVNKVILLKGGFGAGKTRQTGILFGEKSIGVVAPDKAKEIVKRALPSVPHAAAHVQGSQIAYTFFDDLIKNVSGTFVYDSSLSRPSDLRQYINQAEKSGKKVIVYDVARNDMARSLSVLKRKIGGVDPIIPLEFVKDATIRDKINRVGCMEVVLNSTRDPDSGPEYHFLGANAQGTDTREVLVLRANNIIEKTAETQERLSLEGVHLDLETGKFIRTISEQSLEDRFAIQFARPVRELMSELSQEEREALTQVFSHRTLTPTTDIAPNQLLTPKSFYDSQDPTIKANISEKNFIEAFSQVSESSQQQFFTTLQEKIAQGSPVTYEDLPFAVALTIHGNLAKQPAIWPKE
jgi:hypothetical protein